MSCLNVASRKHTHCLTRKYSSRMHSARFQTILASVAMNKCHSGRSSDKKMFGEDSNDGRGSGLGGGSLMSDAWGLLLGVALYSKIQSIMGNGNMGTSL